jgi:glutamate 5-kinase
MARYVIKLGSNIVADETGALRADLLTAVCSEVAARHENGDAVVLVSSGAIARGIEVLELGGRPTAMADLQAASAVGQGKLYRVYDEMLRDRGIVSAQVLLTFFDVGHRNNYLNARQTLGRLLEWGVVPVVNENDTTATEEISFGDNDFLAAQVAIMVGANRLVLLTNQDGLHQADPRTDPSAPLVDLIDHPSQLSEYEIGQAASGLGSGGMRSKVVAAEMATAAGIPTTVASGLREGALTRALAGEKEGTRFSAQEERYSSFELWLRYAKPTRGTLTVDAGAEKALRDAGASLLPVGVSEVEGDFEPGDAVELRGDSGVIGKGICNYSADELARVAGRKSDEVGQIIGRSPEAAVHRDYLALG